MTVASDGWGPSTTLSPMRRLEPGERGRFEQRVVLSFEQGHMEEADAIGEAEVA